MEMDIDPLTLLELFGSKTIKDLAPWSYFPMLFLKERLPFRIHQQQRWFIITVQNRDISVRSTKESRAHRAAKTIDMDLSSLTAHVHQLRHSTVPGYAAVCVFRSQLISPHKTGAYGTAIPVGVVVGSSQSRGLHGWDLFCCYLAHKCGGGLYIKEGAVFASVIWLQLWSSNEKIPAKRNFLGKLHKNFSYKRMVISLVLQRHEGQRRD